MMDELRARLSPTQRQLLNVIAAYEEQHPAGIPAIAIKSNLELDDAQLEAALNPLGGDVVFSSGSDHALRRVRLTFLGFLLTDHGEELENLFVQYFEYWRRLLTNDPETRKVDLDTAITECGLSASQGRLFKRMFFSSPFHGSGGLSDTNLPPHAEQWYAHPDLRRYVQEQVAGSYDENRPVDPGRQTAAPIPGDMSGEPEIAHVLFTDIVGYSKLPMDEQTRSRSQLNAIIRRTNTHSIASARGTVINRPTGDGVALIFFGNPESPVKCAIEIAHALRENNELPLRMGIHSGPVRRDQDINQQSDVAGGGINYAQRVMDAGNAGHILITSAVAENLNQLGGWSEHLHDLGEIEVKHGFRLHVFSLYSEDFGNPEILARATPKI
jgi:class 3 adenylate cyclase